jgi:hypothetical protein
MTSRPPTGTWPPVPTSARSSSAWRRDPRGGSAYLEAYDRRVKQEKFQLNEP